jgi:hypothetical protein
MMVKTRRNAKTATVIGSGNGRRSLPGWTLISLAIREQESWAAKANWMAYRRSKRV